MTSSIYKITQLNALQHVQINSNINVKGVIIYVDIKLKELIKNGKTIKIRNFKISDLSNCEVNVALWGDQAVNFSYLPGTVLEISSCQLTNYGGFSLSIRRMTTIQNISDFESADELKHYWTGHYMNI